MFGFELLERENISVSSHKLDDSSFIIVSKDRLPIFMMDSVLNAHSMIETEFDLEHDGNGGAVTELDQNILENIMENAGFRINLYQPLTIIPNRINEITKIHSISRLLRNKITLFHDLIDKNGENKTYNLTELVDELGLIGVDKTLASTLILLMYTFEGLNSD